MSKTRPEGAKFRNTPSACSGDRNFEGFANLFICSIGWVSGIVVGWSSSFAWGDIAIDNGIPIGGAIGGLIVGSSTGYLLSKVFYDLKLKNILILSIGWYIAWLIGLTIHNQLFFEYGTSFTIWFFPFSFTTVIVGILLL